MSVTAIQQLDEYKALTGVNDSVESQLKKLTFSTFSGFVFNQQAWTRYQQTNLSDFPSKIFQLSLIHGKNI